MENRVAKLEDFAVESRMRFDRIDARFDAVDKRLEQTATKSDMADLRVEMHKGFSDIQKSITDMTKWIAATMAGLVLVGLTVLTIILGYVLPRLPGSTATPSVAQPIVIQLPAPNIATPSPLPNQVPAGAPSR
jgi:hypothetical protein